LRPTLAPGAVLITPEPTPPGSSTAIVGFSSIGHFYNHLFEPMFFVVALVLPTVLNIPYEQVLTLIIAGKVLTGVFAPVSGWVADRWSPLGMMLIYFVGFGFSAVAVGFASTPMQMTMALAALGTFGAIYHPVGIAWMVQNSRNRGRALGINGMFGGLGPALAGIFAGALLEWWSWRMVFILPGLVVAATGLVFAWAWAQGKLTEVRFERLPDPKLNLNDTVRVYLILTLAMIVGGMFYNVAQTSLPKVFEGGLNGILGEGTSSVGTAIMMAYGIGGVLQVFTGSMADKYSMKWVYTLFLFLQAPFILLATQSEGAALLVAAILMVSFNIGALPAENGLLARYTPGKWQATAYGMKFIVAFSFSGLGIYLTAKTKELTGNFDTIYFAMAAALVLISFVTATLPSEKAEAKPAPMPVPAE
jgi:MFS transporter, FSR family, fosmidomycin resistance protein